MSYEITSKEKIKREARKAVSSHETKNPYPKEAHDHHKLWHEHNSEVAQFVYTP